MLSAKADTLQHNAKPAKVMKIRTLRVMHTLAFLRSKTVVVPAIPLPKLAEQQVLRNICKVFFISRLPMIILLEALACALPVMFLGRFLHNVGRSSAEVRLRLFGCRNLHSRSCRWYPPSPTTYASAGDRQGRGICAYSSSHTQLIPFLA